MNFKHNYFLFIFIFESVENDPVRTHPPNVEFSTFFDGFPKGLYTLSSISVGFGNRSLFYLSGLEMS